MYTAKINRKEDRGGILEIFVDFSNGVKTYTDSCKPQDKAGFDYWVKSQLKSYNTSEELLLTDNVGKVIDITEPIVVKSAEVLAQELWFNNYRKLQQVQKLIDLGVLTGAEAPVVTLRNKVKSTFLATYIDLM